MNSKIKKLYDEVINFPEQKSLEENIAQRLEKNLNQYLNSLGDAYDRALTKRKKVIYKEINK